MSREALVEGDEAITFQSDCTPQGALPLCGQRRIERHPYTIGTLYQSDRSGSATAGDPIARERGWCTNSQNPFQPEVPGASAAGGLSETAGPTALGGCLAGRTAKSDRGWSASIAVLNRLRPRARWAANGADREPHRLSYDLIGFTLDAGEHDGDALLARQPPEGSGNIP